MTYQKNIYSKFPCKDCPNRHPACHDTCETYKKHLEEHRRGVREAKSDQDRDWTAEDLDNLTDRVIDISEALNSQYDDVVELVKDFTEATDIRLTMGDLVIRRRNRRNNPS